jgi:peptidoglycan-associated lipoprotein
LAQRKDNYIKKFLIFSYWFLAVGYLAFSGCVYYNTFYNAQVYYQQGVKLVKSNPTAAKANFEKTIAKSAVVVKKHFRSKWADNALYLVAMSYYYMGEYEKAIKNFEDLLVVFPSSPYRDEANYYRGLAYLDNEDYGPALVIFYDLEEKAPRFAPAAAFQIAQSFFRKEEYESAIDSLTAFINKFPKAKERKEAMLILAESYFILKKWSEAGNCYRAQTQQGVLDPKVKVSTDLKLAECLLYESKYDSAKILLLQDFSRYPDLVNQANLLLGKLLLAEQKDEAAIQYLSKIRTGDQAAEAYFLLGRKYEEAKEFEKATAYYDTANRFGPKSEFGSNAKKRLSLLNFQHRKETEVKDRAEAQFMLGEVYGFVLNENEAAIREYKRTFDSFPISPYAPKALYAQAWILKNRLNLNDYDTVLRIIIDKYPRTIYANAARQTLGLPEIKLLPEDTASPKPPEESLPVGVKPKSESLAVAPENQPTVPKESLPGRLLPKPESLPKPKQAIPPVRKESIPEIAIEGQSPKSETIKQSSMPEKRRERRRKAEREKQEIKIVPPKTKPETIPVPTESLFQKEVAVKESAKVEEETIISPESEMINLTFSPIHFDFDRYKIRIDDTLYLKVTAKELENDSTLKILIQGYCDPIGTEQYNYKLGLRRANSARDYLIRLGISQKRIEAISLGKEKLVTTDSLEYWKNRRCEFSVESKKEKK